MIIVQRVDLNKAKDIMVSLDTKLLKAEQEFFNLSSGHKLKSDEMIQEIKFLKDSFKTSNEEAKDHKKVIAESKKMLKTREKENHNLEQRLENSLDTNKILKQENMQVKKKKRSWRRELN